MTTLAKYRTAKSVIPPLSTRSAKAPFSHLASPPSLLSGSCPPASPRQQNGRRPRAPPWPSTSRESPRPQPPPPAGPSSPRHPWPRRRTPPAGPPRGRRRRSQRIRSTTIGLSGEGPGRSPPIFSRRGLGVVVPAHLGPTRTSSARPSSVRPSLARPSSESVRDGFAQ